MGSIHVRESPNRKGGHKAYQVRYRDQHHKRRTRTFRLKPDAEAFLKRAAVEVMDGVHIADAATTTVLVAAVLWIRTAEEDGLRRTTLDQYASHVKHHIEPYFRRKKLNTITAATVLDFQRWLRANGRSGAMIAKISTSLYGILACALGRNMIARHPMHGMPRIRRSAEARKPRLEIGIDVPSPPEIRQLIAILPEMPFWQPVLLTAIFTGLRSSELRGVRWTDVDLSGQVIHVRQRADRYRKMGKPKSDAGTRSIPIPPELARTLREWKLRCPRGDENLVFPNQRGDILTQWNLPENALHPALLRAGIITPDGRPKYGMHALRHFNASWLINRRSDGGMELSPAIVQARLGHASINMTLSVYGHLFPTQDDGRLAAGEAYLMGYGPKS